MVQRSNKFPNYGFSKGLCVVPEKNNQAIHMLAVNKNMK